MKGMLAALTSVLMFLTTTKCAHAQTVTLTASYLHTNSLSFSSNQIVRIESFMGNSLGGTMVAMATINFYDGAELKMGSYNYFPTSNSFPPPQIFTGVSNISVYTVNATVSYAAALTVTVTAPATNATPALPLNAVVIPTDAVGPVQIVLESSPDLVNWVGSLPGTYGNTYSNRFFRVRAVAQ